MCLRPCFFFGFFFGVTLLEKVALAPGGAAPDPAPDYSSACDIERHALAYGNTSQLNTALQYLQALDENEAKFTEIKREVFGAGAERITFVRLKDRIGEPNSSFYSDIMINLVFADDPNATVFEFQLQHDDLATIRNQGSHKFCKDLDPPFTRNLDPPFTRNQHVSPTRVALGPAPPL